MNSDGHGEDSRGRAFKLLSLCFLKRAG